MKVLWFGDAAQDAVSDGEEVVRLSQMIKDRGAYRLKEDLGTDPQVLYLPPQGSTT
jgi:molybdopterin-containing oxidoreductase family iron-sulfur binding subunit